MIQRQAVSTTLGHSVTATSPSQAQHLSLMGANPVGPDDEALLAQLAQEVATMRGSAPSQSALVRALLRLARDFDGALLSRLVGWLERVDTAGEPRRPDVLRH
jgi:hypothetical protein